MTDLSLLIVNYRSASLTAAAVRSARAFFSGPLQIVVVDNSVDDGEANALRQIGVDTVVQAPRNLGYGGAVNLGRLSCGGALLALCNPDLVIQPGCLDRLVETVVGGAALAGPRFTWDEGSRWMLPLPEMPTLRTKAMEIAASRFPALAARRDQTRTRRRIGQWSATDPFEIDALSGAMICMRADLFDRLGGFDERFFLYFEEIDLARRARAHGPIVYVPDAVCRHLFGQTAADPGSSNSRYLESEARFFDKWYGASGRALLRMAGASGVPAPPESSDVWALELPGEPDRFVVEASPSPRFPSAAGHFPETSNVRVPPEVIESYRATTLYLRVVDREGRVRRTVAFHKNG